MTSRLTDTIAIEHSALHPIDRLAYLRDMVDLKEIEMYTDGACIGNPGPGGYGVVLVHGKTRKEISGGYRLTTNNRMEIMGAIVGLQALKSRCKGTLFSDSRYLVDSVELGWARKWREKGWMRNKKEEAVNPDLWALLLELCEQHEVRFEWVKGHDGHDENERCDFLATQAAARKVLPADTGYESTVRTPETGGELFGS